MIAWLVLLQASFSIAVAGPATSLEYLPLHVAQAEGLFAAQRLNTTLRSTRSDAGAAQVLATNQVQLVATSLDAALRLGSADGRPPRLVHGLTAAPPVTLLAGPGRVETIRSAADLDGQTVAISAPGAPEDQALGMLLARAHVPMHRVKVLSLGQEGATRALEGGEVAAAVLVDPHTSRLVDTGKAVVVADLRTPRGAAAALGGPTVSAGLFVRAGTELPPDTLRGLRAALQAAATRLGSADPATIRTGLPPTVIGPRADFAAHLLSARGLFLPDGRVTAETLERSIELVVARAPLSARVKLPRAQRLLVE